MWSFETDPDFQAEIDWIEEFVRNQVQPLDYVLGSQWDIHDPEFVRLIQLRQFRLLILETAWLADQGHDWRALRKNVSAVKAIMPQVLNDIASRALYLHGSLGITHEMPFAEWVIQSFHVGLADGPTEVHKGVVAREVLKDVKPQTKMFPDYMRHVLTDRARAQLGGLAR